MNIAVTADIIPDLAMALNISQGSNAAMGADDTLFPYRDVVSRLKMVSNGHAGINHTAASYHRIFTNYGSRLRSAVMGQIPVRRILPNNTIGSNRRSLPDGDIVPDNAVIVQIDVVFQNHIFPNLAAG